MRCKGLLAAFDLDGFQITSDGAGAGKAVTDSLMSDGVIVRAYGGSTIVFGTALTVTPAELDHLFAAFDRALRATAAN